MPRNISPSGLLGAHVDPRQAHGLATLALRALRDAVAGRGRGAANRDGAGRGRFHRDVTGGATGLGRCTRRSGGDGVRTGRDRCGFLFAQPLGGGGAAAAVGWLLGHCASCRSHVGTARGRIARAL